ncbi:hypothetical protein [Streptomyces lydicus]|uniref:hypothetical protein n=1 Tax=Streptomyces lydicus TaxID=47763 RepID=UPI00101279E1|nr:hypothetical protein [Streptomyces lydicus]MCZ1012270.1 hypothetical protein [Streptomyces lydicus]
MNDVLTHPEAAQLVDSLVASGGGVVSYSFGAPGRQIAAAAGARLAADKGASLTVVDFRHMLAQARSVVDEVRPGLACTLLSAGEAARQHRSTGGVLIVHAELLHDPRTRRALLSMAGTADSLIVASKGEFDEPALETLALSRFVFRPSDLTPPLSHESGQGPEVRERHDQTSVGPSRPRDQTAVWRGVSAREDRQRLVPQSSQASASGQDRLTYDEVDQAIQDTDPDEVRRRVKQLQDQKQQRTAAHPAPALAPTRPVTHDQSLEQAAVHQQHRPQGPGRT